MDDEEPYEQSDTHAMDVGMYLSATDDEGSGVEDTAMVEGGGEHQPHQSKRKRQTPPQPIERELPTRKPSTR